MKQHLSVHKHTLFVIITCLLCLPTVSAQDDYQQKKDSLLKVITTQSGEQKLNAYRNLLFLNYPMEETDNALKYADDYIAESQRQSNVDAEMDARNSAVSIMFNYDKKEYQKQRIDEHLAFFHKHNFLTKYYRVRRFLLEKAFQNGEREQALQDALAMYEQAKTDKFPFGIASANYFIGLYYTNLANIVDGEKHWRQALQDTKNCNEQDCRILTIEIYFRLCEMLTNLISYEGKTDRVSEINSLFSAWRSEIQLLQAQNQNSYTLFLDYYTTQIQFNITTNNMNVAENYCDSLEKIGQDPMSVISLFRFKSMIAEDRKNYEKALEYSDNAYQIIMETGNLPYSLHLLKDKIRIISEQKNVNEIIPLFGIFAERLDSLYSEESTFQLNELRTQYEVDKITAEKEKTRNYLIFALIGCILLAIALGIWIYLHRQIARKNRSLYLQIQELLQKEKEAEKLLLEVPEEELSRTMQLFKNLSELMQQEKPFTDPDLNRKKLADRLSTNESYLADAIREATGETFSNYVSNLRLQYTLQLMTEQPDLTFDAVAIDSGHGSYSAFLRLFTKKYGITPSEYRKLAARKRN